MGRRSTLLLLAVPAVLLVGSQLALPPFLGSRIEKRLTERGGTAKVSLRAVPALRLLWADGSRLRLTGDGLRVDLRAASREKVLDRLDGFGEVDIRLANLHAGPFLASSFAFTRGDDDGLYRLALSGEVSARGLADYAAAQLGGGLGPLISGFANNLLALSDQPIPVELDAQIESREGLARLVSGGGSVAGVPAGPLAEALAAAVVAEL